MTANSMIDRFLKSLLALVLVMGGSGCMADRMNFSKTIDNEMVAYINGKYDDHFEYVDVYGGHVGSDSHKIIVSSEKYPDKAVCVIRREIDGKVIITDNYLGIKFEKDTKARLRSCLSESFGEKMFLAYVVNTLASPTDATDQTTLEEYLADPASGIFFSAIVNYPIGTEYQKTEQLLQNTLASAGICCSGKIYFCMDKENFDDLTVDNFYANYLHDESYDAAFFFHKDSVTSMDIMKWEKKDG